jgi:hypothetical protein
MTINLEQSLYYAKYTGGSYLDAFASIPIWASERIAQGSERLFGTRNPEFLSIRNIQEKSPVYRTREKLRTTLDTRPGALYLQSNIIAAIPFMIAGIPVAELAEMGIDNYIKDSPEIVKCVINSLSTLTGQMIAGYTTFMANEVRVNKEKYRENGKLSVRKITKKLGDTIKAFLYFDLRYIGLKTAGQSAMIYSGQDPGLASAIFDGLAMPAWYSIAIPLGLHKNIIETKSNCIEKIESKDKISNIGDA